MKIQEELFLPKGKIPSRQHISEEEKFMNTALEYHRCMVQPGYLAVSDRPAVLCAVCGNGVIIVLRDRVKKIGGVAYCTSLKDVRSEKPTNFHADVAIYSLVRNFLGMNSYKRDLEAQIFGGASPEGSGQKRVKKILKTCRKVFKKLDIDIVSEDVGGRVGRKVMMNTLSGEVAVLKTNRIRRADWASRVAGYQY
ncbi:MAG: chemotaxis protein CheD [Candidatus Omnitrophica bacterium]|nr:chemotaxis protein CheD [Candidatus Omnitrophota bacterium]